MKEPNKAKKDSKKEKPINVKVLHAEKPVSREQLGEIVEKLFQILARERARKQQKKD